MNKYKLYVTSFTVLILILSTSVSSIAQALPSNRKIAFASDQDGDFEIYVMDADGSNVQQLTSNDTDAHCYTNSNSSWWN